MSSRIAACAGEALGLARCRRSMAWKSRVRLELGHGSLEDVTGDGDQATELTFVQGVILRQKGNPVVRLAGGK